MLADWILFVGLTLVAVASALGLLLSKNAVYAALNLIINFVTVAIFYLTLGAPFIPHPGDCLCRGDHGAVLVCDHVAWR
jgi:NADH:ubiquinone oxidoreductase subunit 6 (subunit J)